MFILCIQLDKHLLDLIKHQKRSCAAEAGCSVLVQGKQEALRGGMGCALDTTSQFDV